MRRGNFSKWRGPLFALSLVALSFSFQSCLLNTVNTFTADSTCSDEIEDFHQFQATLSPHGCFTSACHFSWGKYNSEDDYVSEGLLVKGISGSSLIYTKIAGTGGGGDMPLGFFPDVSSECQTKLATYINGL